MLSMIFNMRSLGMVMGLVTYGACGGSEVTPQPYVIEGTIQNWQQGGGYQVRARTLLNSSGPPIASAPIESNGHFRIELPSVKDIIGALQTSTAPGTQTTPGTMGCSVDVTTSEKSVRFYAAQLFAYSSASSDTGTALFHRVGSSKDANQILVGYTYVDRDFSQVGSILCLNGGGRTIINYNQYYKMGWNSVVSEIATFDTTSTTTTSIRPAPANAKWMDTIF